MLIGNFCGITKKPLHVKQKERKLVFVAFAVEKEKRCAVCYNILICHWKKKKVMNNQRN